MLMLKAKNSDGDWVLLDVYDEQSINLSKQFSEVEQINKPIGSFSLSFRLPATKTNREYFGAFYDANALNAINPKRKREAVVEVDTIPVLRGFLQLKGAYTKVNKYHEYEVVVFGELLSLREQGDKLLSELDWSDYEHELTRAAVEDSIDGTLFGGDIIYGVVERGQPSASDLVNGFGLYPAELTMFLKHKVIVDKCFEAMGIEYQSDFLNSELFANFYTPLINSTSYTVPKTPLSNPLHVGIISDFSALVGGGNILDNWSDSAPFYDTENNYNAALNIYTAPFSGVYSFTFYVTLTAGVDTFIIINPYIQDTAGNTVTITGSSNQQFFIQNGQTTSVIENVTAQLDSGVNYNFGFEVITPFGVGTFELITFEGLPTLGLTEGTGVVLNSATQPLYDFDVSPVQQFPRMTVTEYLSAMQRAFNLVFIPDSVVPNRLIIEPFNDYMNEGDFVDWSTKLHIGKDKDDQILPTTDIQRRKIEFTFSEDRDVVNELYKNQGRTYGRYLIEDTENDFSAGELKVQSGFGAFPLRAVGAYRVHFAVNESGSPVESRLKLAYYGGNTNGTMDILDDLGTTTVNFPYFGHYSVPTPNVTDIDLNYGGEIPQHNITGNPIDNLFNTYWRRWVNELFSAESRKRIAYFRLNANDIYNAKFNDKIWIIDSYWRILKMEADVNTEGLAKVELIKILDSTPICSLTPSGISNGVITFEDAAGDPATATEACCLAYGYTWNGTNCIQLGTIPPPVNLAPPPDTIGGVELRSFPMGAIAGFEILSYRGAMTTNELRTEAGRMRLPYGCSMTFEAEVLITEFDKVNGITAVEKQLWEGICYLQYDDASPDFTRTIQRVRRVGDGSTSVGIEVTNSGDRLIWEVDDAASEFADVTIVMRIDYVLARN